MPGYHWLPDVLKRVALRLEGERDAKRLCEEVPGFLEWWTRSAGWMPELRRAYLGYLSIPECDPVMASSLPLARFTAAWCAATGARSVADLGSGFSSWLLRWWSARSEEGLRVTSVDDSETWLERSRAFVSERGLDAGGFLSWSEFREREGRFDLVLWDFSGVRARSRLTEAALERVAPGGAILFDDIHKARMWRAARRARKRHGLRGRSLRAFTRDLYGRFAWIGMRPE